MQRGSRPSSPRGHVDADEGLGRLRALGFGEADAQELWAHFDGAERRGKQGHGHARIPWLEGLEGYDPSVEPTLLEEEDGFQRWHGGGAIGYLSWGGDLDTAIHIRTVVVKDGQVHVQAGGGTVADAKPAYEYNESVNKAKAIFRAVELACEQPDWE